MSVQEHGIHCVYNIKMHHKYCDYGNSGDKAEIKVPRTKKGPGCGTPRTTDDNFWYDIDTKRQKLVDLAVQAPENMTQSCPKSSSQIIRRRPKQMESEAPYSDRDKSWTE